jgi:hypothetical protein
MERVGGLPVREKSDAHFSGRVFVFQTVCIGKGRDYKIVLKWEKLVSFGDLKRFRRGWVLGFLLLPQLVVLVLVL